MRPGLVVGRNVDRVDIAAGLKELKACGYTEAETVEVIKYALQRWSKGEEDKAQRMAIDETFHGIDLTSFTRVIAAAISSAEVKHNAGDTEG